MRKTSPEDYRRMISVLGQPLSTVKGVGPKFSEKLAGKGIRTLGDALAFLPIRYEDRTRITPLAMLAPGGNATFTGELISLGATGHYKTRTLEGVIKDGSGTLSLKWFRGNFEWIMNRYKPGTRLVGFGAVNVFRNRLQVIHPQLEEMDEDGADQEKVVPVYSETDGIHPRKLRQIIGAAVRAAESALINLIPEEALLSAGLDPGCFGDPASAWRDLHFPSKGGPDLEAIVGQARKAIVLEEFFFLELGLLLKKQGEGRTGITFRPDFKLIKPLLASLPFELTDAQRRVLTAIRRDMESPRPMLRLLQGDVGSGKTLVALLAALMCVESGWQAALMAPTEVLAEQHYGVITKLTAGLGINVGLLTGSVTGEKRDKTSDGLAGGEVDFVIGTHALIQESVKFKNLGLVIVDEQHRFGVMQRASLAGKGTEPDLLVMTATPIPRSLSMTVYGDLDLSVIDQLPPGRKPVTTRIVRKKREEAFAFARSEIEKGRQVYVVCPLVEESEKIDLASAVKTLEDLRDGPFKGLRLGLLHGRMRSDEKEAALKSFYQGETDVLVSTTVIEVGIDHPNATVMMIEHAERYGLSQLHQLRGRVGRGSHQSWCILLPGEHLSEDARQRLKIMAETEDGFLIAEEDLKIRGPGDMLGTRQSGLPDFSVANIIKDGIHLETARAMAHIVLDRDPGLKTPENALLKRALYDRWAEKLALVTSG